MKKLIALALILTVKISYSQELYNVKLSGDTVYNNGKELFLCKAQVRGKSSFHSLRSLTNKPIALLQMQEVDSQLKCSARFPMQMMRYECLYPLMDISVLMESYVRNKVIVNGSIDTIGLKAYCAERKISLENIQVRKAMTPAKGDSTMAARAKQDMENQAKFAIYNSSAVVVRLFLGSSSSNRMQFVLPGKTINEHLPPGEKVCILDKEKKELDCRIIKKGDKEFKINKAGIAFE